MAIIILIVAALLALADQGIKLLAVQYLKGAGKVTVIDKLLFLDYTENRGAAFSMLADKRWIFIVFTVFIIAVFIWAIFKYKPTNKLMIISSMLIIGGGIGNLIDRIYLGYVVDYIYWSFFTPVCNFADYCITSGTVLLMIYIIFFTDTVREKKLPDTAENNAGNVITSPEKEVNEQGGES
ncbi:MAG: signal peptidase II [Acutalibacteraceae bacterium]